MILRGIKLWAVISVIVVVVTGCAAATSTHQSATGHYLDDSSITAKVKAAFVADNEVSTLAIQVGTRNGIVRLSGSANSSAEVDRAVSLARRVEGVKSVENDIQLK